MSRFIWYQKFYYRVHVSPLLSSGCDTLECCCRIPTFRRSMLPPSSGWSEDVDSMVLRNVGILPQHYTASQPRIYSTWILTAMKVSVYERVSRSFRTGHLEPELQMAQFSATRCSCIAILWVSLVSFAAITLYVASQRVFIVVSVFLFDSVRKLLDIPYYLRSILSETLYGSF
jgi:hypothetical protein